jgi:hypothetical protein
MATTVNVARTEDLLPVGSRVSWGAIFAGAMVALALYLLFSVLGTAIGLTVSSDVEADELGTGAAIYAILVNLIALFVGGWVTSQCAVGENKLEAGVYGVILWGVVFAILLWLMVSGVRMGFNAVMGEASGSGAASLAAPQITPGGLRDSLGIGAGQSQPQGTPQQPSAAASAPPDVRAVASDPRTVEAAWWTFGGILLSMVAAIGGALAGSGPNLILRRVVVASSPVPMTPPA